jgi:hypothetical protein
MLHDRRLDKERQASVLLRERVIAELGPDEQAIADMIEGSTCLHDVIVSLAQECKRREAQAEAMAKIIGENESRKARHEKAARSIRDAIGNAMMEVNLKKVESPDLTILARPGNPGVKVYSEDMLPEWAWKETIVRKPDLTRIKERAQREIVAGAVKTNGQPIVTLRGV